MSQTVSAGRDVIEPNVAMISMTVLRIFIQGSKFLILTEPIEQGFVSQGLLPLLPNTTLFSLKSFWFRKFQLFYKISEGSVNYCKGFQHQHKLINWGMHVTYYTFHSFDYNQKRQCYGTIMSYLLMLLTFVKHCDSTHQWLLKGKKRSVILRNTKHFFQSQKSNLLYPQSINCVNVVCEAKIRWPGMINNVSICVEIPTSFKLL